MQVSIMQLQTTWACGDAPRKSTEIVITQGLHNESNFFRGDAENWPYYRSALNSVRLAACHNGICPPERAKPDLDCSCAVEN